MKETAYRILVLSLAAIVFPATSRAELRVANIFGDNMVVQRDTKVALWGWDEPGTRISVKAGRCKAKAKAGADGKWSTRIGPFPVGSPFRLTVEGDGSRTFTNVVAGEVWICSGQSNMEWPVDRARDSDSEKASANFPMIRHVKINKSISTVPQSEVSNSGWQICTPQSVGGFTAVGYFFARSLHQELNVPIGLVHTSWGGTIAEAWISGEALKTHPDFKATVEGIEGHPGEAAARDAAYRKAMQVWQAAYENALNSTTQQWQGADLNDADWQEMKVPGPWEQQGFPNLDGLMWYRKTVEIPEAWVGRELTLSMSAIDDIDDTWVNGSRIGGTQNWAQPRRYPVPGALVKTGKLVIAVRVNDTGGVGGFHGNPDLMALSGPDAPAVSLAGNWKYKVSDALAKLPPKPVSPGFNGPNNPMALYNAMVHPLVPYTLQGAIWYQGESNVGRARQYRTLFPLLIEDWRAQWKHSLPFYFVQLANYKAPPAEPAESDWAELREAQSMALALPDTGQAVIIDIGEAGNIHPRNKQDVGKRLALHALAKLYGKELVCSGPEYTGMSIENQQVRLRFKHVGGGLVAMGGPLKHFAIAGEDRKFVWANAEIDGETVVVSHPEVSSPAAVRYAWANNPEGCNLYNAEGLPASPFRTDQWVR